MAASITIQVPIAPLVDRWRIYGVGDPSTGPGVAAGVGSRFEDDATGAVYVKTGSSATAWTLASAGTGGGLPTPSEGAVLYGLGGAWAVLPIGVEGQVLHVESGYPRWGTVTPPIEFLSLLRSPDSSPLLSPDGSSLVPLTP